MISCKFIFLNGKVGELTYFNMEIVLSKQRNYNFLILGSVLYPQYSMAL